MEHDGMLAEVRAVAPSATSRTSSDDDADADAAEVVGVRGVNRLQRTGSVDSLDSAFKPELSPAGSQAVQTKVGRCRLTPD